MFYIILFLTYLTSLCFYGNKLEQLCIVLFCCFLLYKFILDERKCTVSYLECKIRKVKKEKGFVYNALNEIYDLNKTKYKNLIVLFIVFILLLNLKKSIYN